MNNIEAMKQALGALDEIHVGNMTPLAEEAWNKAITALHQVIEQAEKQEPVAWMCPHDPGRANQSWTLDVQHDENGEAMLEFPQDFLESTGWQPGDCIQWIDRGDGSWEIKKRDTEFVLVETVQTFRHRYVVEVPRGKSDWALDTVSMKEAKEFSQQHLGETIVSHRVIASDEVLRLCDQDNDYCKSWSEDKKFDSFVTEWKSGESSVNDEV